MTDLFNLRHDFSSSKLDERDVLLNPIAFFSQWLNEALEANVLEPNAMNLATVDAEGKPSSRIVLLKEVKRTGFVLFTNYESRKAQQLEQNEYCTLHFSWLQLERQVCIEGIAERISENESDAYFAMRPTQSKLAAWASPQSRSIPNRDYLDQLMLDAERRLGTNEIPRPQHWGGYLVKPYRIQFWQGRENRLHDRIEYTWQNNQWKIERLAP